MSAVENPVFAEIPRKSGLGDVGLGTFSVVAANAGLAFLYFYYDLTLVQLAIVYWLESLWIGIFCALKLITASMIGDPYENNWVRFSGGAGVLTSIIAIGFVGGEFLALFFAIGVGTAIGISQLTGESPSMIFFEQIGLLLGISTIFIAGHGISFIANFIFLKEYRSARAGALLALPFKRCFALIGTLLVGFGVAFLVPAMRNSNGFAVALIICKLLWDYRSHLRERTALRESNKTVQEQTTSQNEYARPIQ